MPVAHGTRPSPRLRGHDRHAASVRRLFVDDDVGGGLVGDTGDVNHPVRIERALSQQIPARSGPGQSRAGRNGPRDLCGLRRVDRFAAEDAAIAFCVELVEPLPDGGVVQIERSGMGKELERAVVLRDQAQDFGVAMMQIKQGELLHERIASHQHRADRMRAAVGRAEHDEARARVRAHALPRRLTFRSREHRAHDEAAHGMREDADRLIGALERIELRVDGLAQR